MELGLICLRVLINPFINLFQKRLTSSGVSSLFIVLLGYVAGAFIALPFMLHRGFPSVTSDLFVSIAVMALLGTTGNVLLVLALSRCDLSIFGPINSFKPAIGLGIAFLILGEIPSSKDLAGVCIIIAGSAVVSYRAGEGISFSSLCGMFFSGGVILRLISLTLISAEAVAMKKVILLSDPFSAFFLWSVSGIPLLIAGVFLLRPGRTIDDAAMLLRDPLRASAAVLLYAIMQLFTFIIFSHVIVGISLALFQLSSIISVFLGRAFFGEKHLLPRLAGAAVMMAGSILILLK